MQLKTTQKYFSIMDKFSIVDSNDRQLFFAQSHFKFRQNCTLYNLDGSMILELECKIISVFGKYFIKNIMGEVVGTMTGVIHKPFIQKWKLEVYGQRYILRSGGLHCKVFEADEKWKYKDKSNCIAKITKRIAKIRDTYEIDFDDSRMSVQIASICMIWMDCRFHAEHH